jgi:Phage integrase family
VELFSKEGSKYLWYDFTVRGRRYRGSTQETNQHRAAKIAALKFAEAVKRHDPLPRRAPVLRDFSTRFLEWVDAAQLEGKTKTYYNDGWRMLKETPLSGMRLDAITNDDLERVKFPGGAATGNCARRTLRRMLHRAEDWNLIGRPPKIKMAKEHGRSLILDEAAERKLLAGAAACEWRPTKLERFIDVIALMRETGMRNERELYRVRVEHIDFVGKYVFVPDSKTEEGRRSIPLSDRAYAILRKRCGARTTGWLFPSKTSASEHVTTLSHNFRDARRKGGLPEELVLYCGRHDFGTRVLSKTGNLKLVMMTMGHKSVSTAMKYQHPELEIVRAALNADSATARERSA